MLDYNLNKDVPNFKHICFANNHKEMKVMSTDIELITIRECTQLIPGLSYYTVRSLIERGEIQAFRTGKGKGGKILVYKKSFLEFFEKGGETPVKQQSTS